jgi:hypothetical protein
MDVLRQLSAKGAGEMLIGSLAVLVLSAAFVPIVIRRLPADHFVRHRHGPSRQAGALGMFAFWLRNAAGALLLIAGFAMLVLPGQGVLTILAALSLLSFPGKRTLQLRLLRVPAIRGAIDRMRRRAGKPPFQLDEPASMHSY